MGTPTAAFLTAVAAKVRLVAGAKMLKNWTSKQDKTVDEEVEAVTESVIADAAQEVADKLGDVDATDITAVSLASRLVQALMRGEYSGNFKGDQQQATGRVYSAINKERTRRILGMSQPKRSDVGRPAPDYSKEHPANTLYDGRPE